MKINKNKKGFTLTELIIVIVIIGILAAVLIPPLSSYIKKAKKSAAEQDAMTMYKEYLSSLVENSDAYTEAVEQNYYVDVDGKYYVVIIDGALKATLEQPLTTTEAAGKTYYECHKISKNPDGTFTLATETYYYEKK